MAVYTGGDTGGPAVIDSRTLAVSSPGKNNQGVPAGDSKVMVPDAALRYARPRLRAGGASFQWPVGPEGFRRYGNSTIAIHHYIGGQNADVDILHYNEGHIELTGTFAGIKSPEYVVALENVLTSRKDKSLFAPGVFPAEEPVVVENYDFTHAADDRTHSIDYTISLVRVGTEGASQGGSSSSSSVKMQVEQSAIQSPSVIQKNLESQSSRYFVAAEGADTFRSISAVVYGSADKWTVLVDLNKDIVQQNPDRDISFKYGYQLAYQKWPLGTHVRY